MFLKKKAQYSYGEYKPLKSVFSDAFPFHWYQHPTL